MERQTADKADLPDTPGVYFFLGRKKEILYIGKATSLRDRVKSYFSRDLSEARGPKIVKMVQEAKSLDWRETDSVLEAMLLEADLIKKFEPPYNTDLKDDKSDNCVIITDETFPRVLLVRKRELDSSNETGYRAKAIYGPFPESGKLQVALKLTRKIFPFRDACQPNQGRPCFNRQLGLCPGVCTGEISRRDYAKTILNIRRFFEGKKSAVVRSLKRDMAAYAKRQEFEKASEAKRQLFALEHIADVALISSENEGRGANAIHSQILENLRIEAFDVAHTSGKETVGVMTVVRGGKPDKSGYRMFRIRSAASGDDLKALEELLTRRFRHDEWEKPDLIVVDGGVTQLGTARHVLEAQKIEVSLVSVVKNERHQPSRLLGDTELAHGYRNSILLANREAHRFAVSFHRRRRDKV